MNYSSKMRKKIMIKKLLKNEFTQNIVGFLISIYIKFSFQTSLWYSKNDENIEKLIKNKRKILVLFWHNRLLMAAFCWKYKKKFKMLISGHRDGKIISKAVSHLGIETIHGSSNKNKISSAKQILTELNDNNIVGITPDGPRGPKQKIKEGLVSMQKRTGAIIVPLSYSAKYNVTLKSWDSFLFSFPFNKFVAVWGNPIFYDDKKKLKDNVQNVQNELDRVTSLSENLSK